jgi:hypothetical protein
MISSFKKLRFLESKNALLGQGLQYDKNAEFLKGLDLLQIVDFTDNNLEKLKFTLARGVFLTLILYAYNFSNFGGKGKV